MSNQTRVQLEAFLYPPDSNASLSGPAAEADEERRAIIEEHARPWMIAAYVLTAIGCAVLFFGPHVALDEYSPLRLGAVVVSLACTAYFLLVVSFRYPESIQGNEFRVAIALVGGVALTGVLLWFAGLFDADFNVLGTQAVARWLTQWEGGSGQSFIAGGLSVLPALPAVGLFGYLFNADASFQRWLHPVSMPKRRPANEERRRSASPVRREKRNENFRKGGCDSAPAIFAALFVGLLSFGGIVDNGLRNFAPGVIAMAISAAVIVLAGGFLLRNSK